MNRETAQAQEGFTLVAQQTILEPGRQADFPFQVLGPDGLPVTAYRQLHERELHLIVVRHDLATFSHLHPAREADGTWSVQLDLPLPGSYRAFADLAPTEGPDLTLSLDLTAPGEWVRVDLPAPAMSARADAYQVELGGALTAGAHSELAFTVAADGKPVGLEPYLGALGHLVALRASDLAYLHVHPLEASSGATVRFGVAVPSPGAYRLFLQFRHGGLVHTAAFTLEASESADPPTPGAHTGHDVLQ